MDASDDIALRACTWEGHEADAHACEACARPVCAHCASARPSLCRECARDRGTLPWWHARGAALPGAWLRTVRAIVVDADPAAVPRTAPLGRSLAFAVSCALVYVAGLAPVVLAVRTLQVSALTARFGLHASVSSLILTAEALARVLGQAVVVTTVLALLPASLVVASRVLGRPLSRRAAAHAAWSSFAFATLAWIPIVGLWMLLRSIGFLHRSLGRDARATALALALVSAATLVARALAAPLVDALTWSLI